MGESSSELDVATGIEAEMAGLAYGRSCSESLPLSSRARTVVADERGGACRPIDDDGTVGVAGSGRRDTLGNRNTAGGGLATFSGPVSCGSAFFARLRGFLGAALSPEAVLLGLPRFFFWTLNRAIVDVIYISFAKPVALRRTWLLLLWCG